MVTGAKKRRFALYGGKDPAEIPRYTRVDASRATGVPASTIGVWVHGMPYTTRRGQKSRYDAVISLPDANDPRLSFNNLLEVNALRALRQSPHDVELKSVRTAIARAEKELGVERLLLSPNLRTSAGELFLDYYFELVSLAASRQHAMRAMLEHCLLRVEIDNQMRAAYFPMPRLMNADAKPILVSPYISFGNAIVERRGVSTYAIRARMDAGETKDSIQADYDLTSDEFEEAILYETAA